MRFVPFIGAIAILFCAIALTRAVDETPSFNHPYTSLTPGALRADPARAAALLQAASTTYESLRAAFDVASAPFRDLYPASKRWMELEVNLAKSKDDARKALENHSARMKGLRKKIQALAGVGVETQENLSYARYADIEADILLLNAGGKPAE